MKAQRLEGKIALVSGANRGIGRGIALCLAEEGADVVVNFRTHAEEGAQVVKEIEHLERRAIAWQANVAERSEVEAMFAGALKHFGRLDIVVANAAQTVRESILRAQWDNVLKTLAVTQFGVFHTCQLGARRMVEQGQGGKIIIVSSIHALHAFANSAAYDMAKAAINHLSKSMAAELARHHINVNVINPGWIDTPGERDLATDEELRKGALRIPWKRMGTAREIGRCVAFLASEDAEYMTGSELTIDGGILVGMGLPETIPEEAG